MKKSSKQKFSEELHNVLRDKLKQQGFKQSDLVFATEFTQTYISQIMTGSKFPPLDTLCEICDAIGIEVHEVLYETHLRATMKKEIIPHHVAIKFRELELNIKTFYSTAI